MKKISPRVKGIVCILFAAFGFSMMSVFIRLAGDVPTAEKAFFRNIVALAVVGALLAVKRVPLKPEKGSWPFITCRAVFGTIGMLLNFYAVDHLVLADANMLNKLSPFLPSSSLCSCCGKTNRRADRRCADGSAGQRAHHQAGL